MYISIWISFALHAKRPALSRRAYVGLIYNNKFEVSYSASICIVIAYRDQFLFYAFGLCYSIPLPLTESLYR